MEKGKMLATRPTYLVTVFQEADVNHDRKLTFEEWYDNCGKGLEEEQLRKLFKECDTIGDGVLDIQEFTKGCENQYLIKWAQEPKVENIKDATEMILASLPPTQPFSQSKTLCRRNSSSSGKSWKKTTTMLKFSLSNLGASRPTRQPMPGVKQCFT